MFVFDDPKTYLKGIEKFLRVDKLNEYTIMTHFVRIFVIFDGKN